MTGGATDLIAALRDAERMRARGELLARLAGSVMRAGSDAQAAFRHLVEGAASLLDAEGAGIALVEGDRLHVQAACGSLAGLEGEVAEAAAVSLATAAMATREVVVSNDVRSDARVDGRYVARAAIRQGIVAPLCTVDEVVGVLTVVNPRRGAFDEEDVATLRLLAEDGGIAIWNSRLQERAAQGAREARALADIVHLINQSLELERVFLLVVRHAAELLGARGAGVGTLDQGDLRWQAVFGPIRMPTGARHPVDGYVIGEAIRERRPVRTTDLHAQAARWPQSAALWTEGAQRVNALAVPLLVGGRAIGGILVYGNAQRDFDAHDEQLLLTLANHAAVAIENARLYRSAARTARHASILAETARTLASSVTARSLYEGVGRIVTNSLGAEGFSLHLTDVATGQVEMAHVQGTGGIDYEAFTAHFWELPSGQVVRTATPHFQSDLADFVSSSNALVLEPALAAGMQSLALLPVIVQGQPRGLLALRYRRRHEFDEDERLLLLDFATQVAIAMRNARLFDDLERRAARFAAVASMQQAISASISLDAVYRAVYQAVASVVDAPCFAFLAGNPQGEGFLLQYLVVDGGEVPLGAREVLGGGEHEVMETYRTGTPRIVDRPTRWWLGTSYEHASDRPVLVELDVPVTYGERPMGVLQVLSYRADAYAREDVDLVGLLARQAALAIENARLFGAQRQERELAEAGAAIARVALEGGEMEAVAPRVLAILQQLVRAAGAVLAVVEEQALSYVAASGTTSPSLGLRVPLDQTVAREVLRTGRPLRFENLRASAPPSVASIVPAAPGYLVPMMAHQRVIGVIGLVGTAEHDLTAAQRAIAERLAAATALAIDSVRLAEAERRRHERERTLATALATMDQPVFVLSLESRIRYANTAAVQQYGYGLDALTGMHVSDLIAAARPSVGASSNGASSNGASSNGASGSAAGAEVDGVRVWTAEHVHRRRDGHEFAAAVAMSRITDEEGNAVGQVLTVRDLTDERRLAEQLRQTEKLAAVGELVAGVAHELNNPLTGISAFAQLLLEEELGSEQSESVRLIKKEADRAVAVIRDLLLFSRKTGPRRVPIDLNQLLQQTVRLRAYGLRSEGVEVRTEFHPALPVVEGDDQKLQQVFLNLVVNAEYAMQKGERRRLTIRTGHDALQVWAIVTDTGIGMSREVLEHIFEPFFTTKPAGVGTGLGLSVSYGIVQSHGGTITVESTPSEGSAFTIRLPLPPSPSLAALPAGSAA